MTKSEWMKKESRRKRCTDTKPPTKNTPPIRLLICFTYQKNAKTQPNPQPYPLYPTFLNGVSPVRLWHRPVTIKNETLSLAPPANPRFQILPPTMDDDADEGWAAEPR